MTKGKVLRENSKIAHSYVGVDIVPAQDAGLLCEDCLLGVEIEYSLDGKMTLLLDQDGIRAGHEYRVQLEPSTGFKKMFFPLTSFKQPSWTKQNQPLLSYKVKGMKLQLDTDKLATSDIAVRSIRLMTNQ